MCVCVCARARMCTHTHGLGRVRLFATPWTVAHQAPLSMGIFQARILEWTAISSSRASSQPRYQTHISCTGRQVLYHWATIGGLVVNTSPRQGPSQGVPILPMSHSKLLLYLKPDIYSSMSFFVVTCSWFDFVMYVKGHAGVYIWF